MTYGRSCDPSPRQACMTVNLSFSWPVVKIKMLFTPFSDTVEFHNVRGTWSLVSVSDAFQFKIMFFPLCNNIALEFDKLLNPGEVVGCLLFYVEWITIRIQCDNS